MKYMYVISNYFTTNRLQYPSSFDYTVYEGCSLSLSLSSLDQSEEINCKLYMYL